MPQRAKVSRVCRLSHGMSSGEPEPSGWAPPSSRPASSSDPTSPATDRAVSDAALGRRDLDHRLEPVEAARARAHDVEGDAALPGGVREGRRDLVGADGERAGIARHDRGARSSPRLGRRSASRRAASRRPTRPAVEHRRRRGGAKAQAVDRLERDAAVGRSSLPSGCRAAASVARRAPIAARRLAGLGAAQLERRAGRLAHGGSRGRR